MIVFSGSFCRKLQLYRCADSPSDIQQLPFCRDIIATARATPAPLSLDCVCNSCRAWLARSILPLSRPRYHRRSVEHYTSAWRKCSVNSFAYLLFELQGTFWLDIWKFLQFRNPHLESFWDWKSVKTSASHLWNQIWLAWSPFSCILSAVLPLSSSLSGCALPNNIPESHPCKKERWVEYKIEKKNNCSSENGH